MTDCPTGFLTPCRVWIAASGLPGSVLGVQAARVTELTGIGTTFSLNSKVQCFSGMSLAWAAVSPRIAGPEKWAQTLPTPAAASWRRATCSTSPPDHQGGWPPPAQGEEAGEAWAHSRGSTVNPSRSHRQAKRQVTKSDANTPIPTHRHIGVVDHLHSAWVLYLPGVDLAVPVLLSAWGVWGVPGQSSPYL